MRCSDDKERVGRWNNGKLPHLFIPSKLQPGNLSLQWKSCLWTELQTWFLHLQWKNCAWTEHSDDDDGGGGDDDDDDDDDDD